MMTFFQKLCVLLVTLLVPVVTFATAWQIVPADSSLSFVATQNNAPVTGKFTHFSGEINFDPANLKSSNTKMIVDIGSVSSSYMEVVSTLKSADWFDVKQYTQAVFTAKHFEKVGEKTYKANGSLTLRDKTVPVIVMFDLEEYSQTKAHVKGRAMLKRTMFGVGRGEWANTDAIKDEVQVQFDVSAIKK